MAETPEYSHSLATPDRVENVGLWQVAYHRNMEKINPNNINDL